MLIALNIHVFSSNFIIDLTQPRSRIFFLYLYSMSTQKKVYTIEQAWITEVSSDSSDHNWLEYIWMIILVSGMVAKAKLYTWRERVEHRLKWIEKMR